MIYRRSVDGEACLRGLCRCCAEGCAATRAHGPESLKAVGGRILELFLLTTELLLFLHDRAKSKALQAGLCALVDFFVSTFKHF